MNLIKLMKIYELLLFFSLVCAYVMNLLRICEEVNIASSNPIDELLEDPNDSNLWESLTLKYFSISE